MPTPMKTEKAGIRLHGWKSFLRLHKKNDYHCCSEDLHGFREQDLRLSGSELMIAREYNFTSILDFLETLLYVSDIL